MCLKAKSLLPDSLWKCVDLSKPCSGWFDAWVSKIASGETEPNLKNC